MKVLATLSVAALALFGLTAQASAFSLNPKSTSPITISGPTKLTAAGVTVACTSNFTGGINAAGVGSITAASFSGGGLCSSVTALNLPWSLTATSATGVSITGVKVTVLGLVTCGPGSVTGALVGAQPTTSVSFSGTIGTCSVVSNPTLTASVPLSITNP